MLLRQHNNRYKKNIASEEEFNFSLLNIIGDAIKQTESELANIDFGDTVTEIN